MPPFVYLLLVAITVHEVFAVCNVCGASNSNQQTKNFCQNMCFPDSNDCEFDSDGIKGIPRPCTWDKRKPKANRCVSTSDTSKPCYYSALPEDAKTDHKCDPESDCDISREECHKCLPCVHEEDRKTVEDTKCYLAIFGSATDDTKWKCVFNYQEKGEIKVDYCKKKPTPKTKCDPGVPGNWMEYIYILVLEGITWFEALELCLLRDAYLATILYESDIEDALRYIGAGPSPWIGMRSTDPSLLFSPVDDTECPVYHHGSPCLGCTERSLWTDTRPIRWTDDGSMCVRLSPDEGTINNDVDCDDKLYAVLCNCDNTASLPHTYTPPFTL
eukprot:158614_1